MFFKKKVLRYKIYKTLEQQTKYIQNLSPFVLSNMYMYILQSTILNQYVVHVWQINRTLNNDTFQECRTPAVSPHSHCLCTPPPKNKRATVYVVPSLPRVVPPPTFTVDREASSITQAPNTLVYKINKMAIFDPFKLNQEKSKHQLYVYMYKNVLINGQRSFHKLTLSIVF